jgi:hypothetical protein
MASANSFISRMGSGIPGDITRKENSVVEVKAYDATNPPTTFGVAVAIDPTSYNIRKIIANDTQSLFYGILVRPFPISNSSVNDGLGVSTVNTNLLADVMMRGYVNALLGGTASAVANGNVYVRVANPSTGKVVGDFEAAADTGVTASATTGVGTSTAGTLSATSTTPAGVYKATLTATGATAAFSVTDAGGAVVGAGNVGTQATLGNGLSFKITAGGTPTSGDYLTLTVAQNTFQVPHSYFTGAADANGNVEIALNMRATV